MYQPVVQLKSGGYLVINPTEALVSIDINSGRSTKEHGIEATAVGTNMEAAREIARQLRLRDMAGLVVIDFIDMELNSNVRKVERAMKDALKNDRARIQVGRISGFGLMEMSRQRLRTGVLEASTRECPHCEGTGLVRTASSAALSVLRLLEEEAAKGKGTRLSLRTSQEASYYVLNTKRDEIAELEHRYGVKVEILPDGETEGARMTIDVSGPRPEHMPSFESLVDDDDDVIEDEPDYGDDEDEDGENGRNDSDRDSGGRDRNRDEGGRDRNRKSRSRRGGRNRSRGDRPEGDRSDRPERVADASAGEDGEASGDDNRGERAPRADHDVDGDGNAPKRRRGRRGGRRRRGGARDESRDGASENAGENRGARSDEADGHSFGGDTKPDRGDDIRAAPAPAASNDDAASSEDDKPKTRRRPRARKAETAAPASAAADTAEGPADTVAEKPKRAPRARKPKVATETGGEGESVAAKPVAAAKADTPAKASKAKAPAAKAAAKPAEPAKAEAKTDAKDDAPAKPARKPAAKSKAKAQPAASPKPESKTGDSEGGEGEGGRRGWWQRTFGT